MQLKRVCAAWHPALFNDSWVSWAFEFHKGRIYAAIILHCRGVPIPVFVFLSIYVATQIKQ